MRQKLAKIKESKTWGNEILSTNLHRNDPTDHTTRMHHIYIYKFIFMIFWITYDRKFALIQYLICKMPFSPQLDIFRILCTMVHQI